MSEAPDAGEASDAEALDAASGGDAAEVQADSGGEDVPLERDAADASPPEDAAESEDVSAGLEDVAEVGEDVGEDTGSLDPGFAVLVSEQQLTQRLETCGSFAVTSTATGGAGVVLWHEGFDPFAGESLAALKVVPLGEEGPEQTLRLGGGFDIYRGFRSATDRAGGAHHLYTRVDSGSWGVEHLTQGVITALSEPGINPPQRLNLASYGSSGLVASWGRESQETLRMYDGATWGPPITLEGVRIYALAEGAGGEVFFLTTRDASPLELQLERWDGATLEPLAWPEGWSVGSFLGSEQVQAVSDEAGVLHLAYCYAGAGCWYAARSPEGAWLLEELPQTRTTSQWGYSVRRLRLDPSGRPVILLSMSVYADSNPRFRGDYAALYRYDPAVGWGAEWVDRRRIAPRDGLPAYTDFALQPDGSAQVVTCDLFSQGELDVTELSSSSLESLEDTTQVTAAAIPKLLRRRLVGVTGPPSEPSREVLLSYGVQGGALEYEEARLEGDRYALEPFYSASVGVPPQHPLARWDEGVSALDALASTPGGARLALWSQRDGSGARERWFGQLGGAGEVQGAQRVFSEQSLGVLTYERARLGVTFEGAARVFTLGRASEAPVLIAAAPAGSSWEAVVTPWSEVVGVGAESPGSAWVSDAHLDAAGRWHLLVGTSPPLSGAPAGLYLRQTPGGWEAVAQPAALVGERLLALDDAGVAHLAGEGAGGALVHMRWSGGGWSTPQTLSTTWVRGRGLELLAAPDGDIHALYSEQVDGGARERLVWHRLSPGASRVLEIAAPAAVFLLRSAGGDPSSSAHASISSGGVLTLIVAYDGSLSARSYRAP